MIPYITYREKNEKDEFVYYILQKEFPHYLTYISTIPVQKALASMPISGYNMWIVFCGVINGAFVPSYKDVLNDIMCIVEHIATWFLANRINIEPKKYEKFKIK